MADTSWTGESKVTRPCCKKEEFPDMVDQVQSICQCDWICRPIEVTEVKLITNNIG